MLEKFIDFLRHEKRYSERTVGNYSDAIRRFLGNAAVQADDTQTLAALTTQQVRTWIADMLQDKESPRTVNLKLTAINRFCKFLMKEKVLAKNPLQHIQRPKMSRRLPEFFEESAVNDLLNSYEASNDYMELRNHTIIELLYTTGIRRAELLALRPCDVYLSEQVIRVTGKGDKQREVPLPDAFAGKLKRYLEVRQTEFPQLSTTDTLFANAMGKSLLPYVINKVVREQLSGKSGFTGKKSPHTLRHSLATHLLNNGADIMSIKEALGHASLAATQVYTHNSFKKLKTVYKKAHPRANVKL